MPGDLSEPARGALSGARYSSGAWKASSVNAFHQSVCFAHSVNGIFPLRRYPRLRVHRRQSRGNRI